MYRFKNSLTALVGMFALIGVISAVTPLTTQGQGKGQRSAGSGVGGSAR